MKFENITTASRLNNGWIIYKLAKPVWDPNLFHPDLHDLSECIINSEICIREIDNNKNIGFISKVKIFKKYRGYGYCSKLIHKIITTSIKMKLIKLYLHVRCDNSIAIKCYKDNSFKITKKNYENHQLFGYTMTLKLTYVWIWNIVIFNKTLKSF